MAYDDEMGVGPGAIDAYLKAGIPSAASLIGG
jgi:hypothetical protein